VHSSVHEATLLYFFGVRVSRGGDVPRGHLEQLRGIPVIGADSFVHVKFVPIKSHESGDHG
jgi:hypothetical protein